MAEMLEGLGIREEPCGCRLTAVSGTVIHWCGDHWQDERELVLNAVDRARRDLHHAMVDIMTYDDDHPAAHVLGNVLSLLGTVQQLLEAR